MTCSLPLLLAWAELRYGLEQERLQTLVSQVRDHTPMTRWGRGRDNRSSLTAGREKGAPTLVSPGNHRSNSCLYGFAYLNVAPASSVCAMEMPQTPKVLPASAS